MKHATTVPSWNLGRVKQGDRIRVDGASPSCERECGRTQDRGSLEGPEDGTTASVDENIIDEFQVSSKTIDNCVEPTISQSDVVKRKLSQSEVDGMPALLFETHRTEGKPLTGEDWESGDGHG